MKDVIIIEDDPAMAMINQKLIERLGYTVVNNSLQSSEAISFLSTNKVDLILLDIMLDEEIDGIEVAKIIRTQSNAPIIFISSLIEPEINIKINEIENTQLLFKPLDYNELQHAIGMVSILKS